MHTSTRTLGQTRPRCFFCPPAWRMRTVRTLYPWIIRAYIRAGFHMHSHMCTTPSALCLNTTKGVPRGINYQLFSLFFVYIHCETEYVRVFCFVTFVLETTWTIRLRRICGTHSCPSRTPVDIRGNDARHGRPFDQDCGVASVRPFSCRNGGGAGDNTKIITHTDTPR